MRLLTHRFRLEDVCARRDLVAQLTGDGAQIELSLKVEPETRVHAKEHTEAQRGVRGNRAHTAHQITDAARGDVYVGGKLAPGNVYRLHEILEQNFARVNLIEKSAMFASLVAVDDLDIVRPIGAPFEANTPLGEATRTGTQASGGAGGSMRLESLDGESIHLFVAPLPSWSNPFGVSSAAAVFLNDGKAVIGSLASMLRRVYRMTAAESRLTEALVNGRTPGEYAEDHGVSINTVRTQVKAAAAKAGASRPSDLVRIVLTGPAVLRVDGQLGQAAGHRL